MYTIFYEFLETRFCEYNVCFTERGLSKKLFFVENSYKDQRGLTMLTVYNRQRYQKTYQVYGDTRLNVYSNAQIKELERIEMNASVE